MFKKNKNKNAVLCENCSSMVKWSQGTARQMDWSCELRGKRTNRSKCCSIFQSLENAYRQVECSRHGIADLVKFASFVSCFCLWRSVCVNTFKEYVANAIADFFLRLGLPGRNNWGVAKILFILLKVKCSFSKAIQLILFQTFLTHCSSRTNG